LLLNKSTVVSYVCALKKKQLIPLFKDQASLCRRTKKNIKHYDTFLHKIKNKEKGQIPLFYLHKLNVSSKKNLDSFTQEQVSSPDVAETGSSCRVTIKNPIKGRSYSSLIKKNQKFFLQIFKTSMRLKMEMKKKKKVQTTVAKYLPFNSEKHTCVAKTKYFGFFKKSILLFQKTRFKKVRFVNFFFFKNKKIYPSRKLISFLFLTLETSFISRKHSLFSEEGAYLHDFLKAGTPLTKTPFFSLIKVRKNSHFYPSIKKKPSPFLKKTLLFRKALCVQTKSSKISVSRHPIHAVFNFLETFLLKKLELN